MVIPETTPAPVGADALTSPVDALTSRWAALLDALSHLGGDLELPAVLARIVDAARELAGARYAAIGVIGPDGDLVEFITSGITPAQREEIGAPPRGRGVLGELVSHPEALRLRDLREHPGAVGFPAGHPVMRSFLGVPVRTGSTVFGNLYLTDKIEDGPAGDVAGDGFTESDEQMLSALAAAAGVAVDNARLYEQVLTRQRWSAASAGASRALVPAGRAAGSGEVARLARAAAGARGVALALTPADHRTGPLLVEAVDGDLPLVLGEDLDLASAELADVLDPAAPALVVAEPVLAARLGDGGQAQVLVVCRIDSRQGRRDRPEEASSSLSPSGEDAEDGDGVLGLLVLAFDTPAAARALVDAAAEVVAFADRVGLSLEVARAQAFRARLAVFEDRDRIARDLHDLVIQRLFAVGLSLQAAGPQALPGWLEQRLESAVDQLDETIEDVRRTIFSLHARPGVGDLRVDLQQEVAVAAAQLGFAPAVHLEGALEALPFALRADVLAVLRESLSNVARHASASAVDVTVTAAAAAGAGDVVTVTVRDDGRGMAREGRRSGLANLEERGVSRGGSLTVESAPGRGTVVRWAAPVR